jgi:hypothetical protein
MIRTLFTLLVFTYLGLLLGQVTIGKATLGKTVLAETRSALNWSGDKASSLMAYAGLGGFKEAKKPRRVEQDPEGLTTLDKEALRKILE